MKKIAIVFIVLFSSLFTKEYVNLLSIGAGGFDIFKDRNRTWQLHIDYKPSIHYWKIRPMVGIMMTKKGSIYTFSGIVFDFILKDMCFVTPSFSAGYYYQGDGKDLGYPLEFKSGIEIGYRFKDKSRIGLNFYHLSNASIRKRNPGEESLILFYSIPFVPK
jgi:lipid A 3-O-deacylase